MEKFEGLKNKFENIKFVNVYIYKQDFYNNNTCNYRC